MAEFSTRETYSFSWGYNEREGGWKEIYMQCVFSCLFLLFPFTANRTYYHRRYFQHWYYSLLFLPFSFTANKKYDLRQNFQHWHPFVFSLGRNKGMAGNMTTSLFVYLFLFRHIRKQNKPADFIYDTSSFLFCLSRMQRTSGWWIYNTSKYFFNCFFLFFRTSRGKIKPYAYFPIWGLYLHSDATSNWLVNLYHVSINFSFVSFVFPCIKKQGKVLHIIPNTTSSLIPFPIQQIRA